MSLFLKFRNQLDPASVSEFDELTANLTTFLRQEHTDNGKHGDIVPDSITLQEAPLGVWADLPYDAARFVGSGSGVWTVSGTNVEYLKVLQVGALAFIVYSFKATTITSATATSLTIYLPEFNIIPFTAIAGVQEQRYLTGNLNWDDNEHSTAGIGQAAARTAKSGAHPISSIQLRRVSPTNATFADWPVSNNLDIRGSVFLPLLPNNLPVDYTYE